MIALKSGTIGLPLALGEEVMDGFAKRHLCNLWLSLPERSGLCRSTKVLHCGIDAHSTVGSHCRYRWNSLATHPTRGRVFTDRLLNARGTKKHGFGL